MAEELERTYVIPLRKVKNVKRTIRAPRAIREVQNFLMKHMKAWERGIQKIPSKVKVNAVKDEEGIVKATLAEN